MKHIVYNMQGLQMLSFRREANSKDAINISRLSKCIYFIKYQGNDGRVSVEKLVVL
ncbi:MAG: T9SS type A sorting domain-containing protein [Bacteroidota bacterium]|nr:T9SS type A sorting domain-containing protein [Bacteroidota bacterium]